MAAAIWSVPCRCGTRQIPRCALPGARATCGALTVVRATFFGGVRGLCVVVSRRGLAQEYTFQTSTFDLFLLALVRALVWALAAA